MKTSEILIIGTGVVGTPLANYLNKHFQVRTISRSSQPPSLRKHKIPHKICDITNFNKLKRVIGNPFLIIHTAMASIPEINENKETGYEVNVGGTQNICKLVSQNPNISALIFLSTMKVFGERDFRDLINEESTLKPYANRKLSRPYILSKIAGESIVKLFDENYKNKLFCILRISTVMGNSIKSDFFLNAFIEKGITGQKITPFKQSLQRPIFFIHLDDICKSLTSMILKLKKNDRILRDNKNHVLNLSYPEPITILDVAKMVRDSVTRYSLKKISPQVKIIDKGISNDYTKGDKQKAKHDISKIRRVLGVNNLIEPKIAIQNEIKKRIADHVEKTQKKSRDQ